MRGHFLLLVAFAVLAACGPERKEPAGEEVALPSGGHIWITRVSHRIDCDGVPALMLEYRTKIPVDDASESEAEAGEMWQYFRPQVEEARMTVALMDAMSTGRGRVFRYTRSPAVGQWFRGGGPVWSLEAPR
jgi:hypothetical protein